MNWKTTRIDLGTLKVKQTTDVIYNYIGNDSNLPISFQAGCGCSIPKWNIEDKTLTVVYTPNPIPAHLVLQQKTSYHSEKYILVNYRDGNVEKLIFTAIITK